MTAMHFRAVLGFIYLAQGFRLIWQPGIRRFVLVPLLLNVALFTLLIFFGLHQFQAGLAWLNSSIPDWLRWIDWLIWPLFLLGLLLAGFYFSLMIANLLAAPFNGPLAEAVARSIQGDTIPAGTDDGLLSALGQAGPALFNEIRKLGYYLLRVLPLLLLFIVPGLNLVAPFIWFAFTAWLLALEYIEFPLAINGIEFIELKKIARDNRLLLLGFGVALALLMMVPVINFMLMPAAVAGATIMSIKHGLSGDKARTR